MTTDSILIPPYGGQLVDLCVPPDERDELREYANHLPSLQLTQRQICDLELLAVGAFSPLTRFMGQLDYQRVLDEMRLADGHLFPIPVTLPVFPDTHIRVGQEIALRGLKNELFAVMKIEELYEWDCQEAARACSNHEHRSSDSGRDADVGTLNISGQSRAGSALAMIFESYVSPLPRHAPASKNSGTATSSRSRRATPRTASMKS